MKLCNHRDPRNGVGSCGLRVCEVSGAKWDWRSLHVFVKEGHLPDNRNWYSHAFECTEKMSTVCPYRVHTPIEKPKPVPKPEKCKRCGARHYPGRGVSQAFCDAHDEFDKQMQPWSPEGSKQPIWPDPALEKRYRTMLWPSLASDIFRRDKWKCQDCKLETTARHLKHSNGEEYIYHETYLKIQHGPNKLGNPEDETIQFEVHHIIPRAKGGTDHPANLKLVCQKCHRKYTDELLGELGPLRAKERRIAQVKEIMPKSLEEFT